MIRKERWVAGAVGEAVAVEVPRTVAMARPPGPVFGIEMPAVVRVEERPRKHGARSPARRRKAADAGVRALLFGRFHA